jgi:His/Glu/Gln/Arg/opine family amino acid ABC transporter permease subunit
MVEMNNKSKTPSQLLAVKEQMYRIPLIRGKNFVYGYLALLIIFGIFLLPANGSPTSLNIVVISLFALLCVGWTVLIFTDQLKKDWFKTITAIILIIILGWLYYRYTTADWGQMIFLFFNLNIIQQAWPLLISGLWITIQIAVFSAIMSTTLGMLLAVFRSFNNRILNIFIIAYVDFFRAMPILVLMFLIYYALPYLGIRLDAVLSGVLALGLNSSAYVSEIFRAGILSVKKGQIEASSALGLSAIQTMRLILLPQAIKVILPPLVGNYVASAKDTALCSSISIIELLKAGLSEQAMLVNPSPLIFSTALYLLMFVPLTRLSSLLEIRMKSRQRIINV